MNKRIKELAEQTETKEIGYYFFDKEKFAELIVKGCCDWIDGSPVTEAGQLILTKSFIIANLKGYFGVKE